MIDINIKHRIESSGWTLSDSAWNRLSDYEKSFLLAEFTGLKTLTYYRQRLEHLGFVNHDRILDAACGMGQWSIALSYLNKFVDGIDLSRERLTIAYEIARNLGRFNCSFQYGSIDCLPHGDESFDGILCYGAFMFTNMPKVLLEFHRVLKKGGRIYINANTFGWYAHLMIDRGIKKRNMAMIRLVLKYIGRTIVKETNQIIVTRQRLNRIIYEKGFDILAIGAEGQVSFLKDSLLQKPPAAYPDKYYCLPSMIEVVAVKRT